MKPENSIRNKKVELAVSSVVFLYAANIVWYFLTGVFEWGDPLGVYLIFIANGILGLILYVAVSLICYRKIKISPKNNRVLRICLIIITGIFLFGWYCFGCFRILSDIKSVSLPGPFCRMRLRRLARWLPIILFVCYAVFNGGWILRWNGHSGCG